MIKIFAVQPEVMAQPEFFREYFKDFGVDKGRWIAMFPSDWRRRVINLVQGLPQERLPTMKKRGMRDKLQGRPYRDRFIKLPVAGDEVSVDWLSAAEALTDAKLARGVLAAENPRAKDNVLVAGDFDPDCDVYFATTNKRVAKTPEDLFEVVQPVVRIAESIDIVDPHVQSVGPSGNSFASFLQLIFEELRSSPSTCRKISVHVRKPTVFRPEIQQRNYAALFAPFLDEDETIAVSFWDLNELADRNHDRHFITNAAAIMSSYGWTNDVEGKPTTDISLKSAETHRRLCECFCRRLTDEFGKLTDDATVTITHEG